MDLEQQVEQLLAAPPDEAVRQFFAQVCKANPGLEVRLDAGEGKGKGVFATKDFAEGDVLIREPPLVGIQHAANQPQALVCAHCFQFLGSVEEQIGRRLAWHRTAAQLATVGEGSSEGGSSSDREEDSSSRGSQGREPGDEELIAGLLAGVVQLPHTEQVPLPAPVACPGGCQREKYCSEACAQAAWQQYHSLLCCGPSTQHAQQAQGSCLDKCKAPAPAPAAAAGSGGASGEQRQRQATLEEFYLHAEETNDIFLLAAKAVAYVLLEAQRLLAEAPAGDASGSSGSSGGSQAAATSEGAQQAGPSGSSSGSRESPERCWAALCSAWEPFAMGHKALWWEAMAVPEDVIDEAEFREGVRELAADSLELLSAALLDARFPALFDLRIWGALIGMFELNNLDLFVPGPSLRWRGGLEALPEAEAEAVEAEAGALLAALDSLEEEDGCEGNAFYSLQACVNHSCAPNAHAFKTEKDTNGSAVILSLRTIKAGEEVTISYIDEEAELEERAAELADYGFSCGCEKCAAERLAQELLLG